MIYIPDVQLRKRIIYSKNKTLSDKMSLRAKDRGTTSISAKYAAW